MIYTAYKHIHMTLSHPAGGSREGWGGVGRWGRGGDPSAGRAAAGGRRPDGWGSRWDNVTCICLHFVYIVFIDTYIYIYI